ncbi:peptidoglycan DD-metalloendopeptidase family protein [Prevotella corporis]|uniref:peptidoglycan DD-metalloendopeptidase family protein n=1 Tax=Prevotella corporis TaxID=28128 RepID=UPI0027E3C299|nr:peptidoglycan DD-metalloendopeptidase family protein [Prevotella corporis]
MRRYRLFLLVFVATAISMKMVAQFYTLRTEEPHAQVRPVRQTVTKKKADSIDTKTPDVTFQTGRGLEITIEKDVPLFVNVKDSLLFNLISQRMNVCLPLDFLKLNSAFGYRKDPVRRCTAFHDGIDLECNHARVYAMLPGIIKEVHYGSKGYGNYIVLEHGVFECLYGHLDQITVKEGDAVSAGTIVGISGNTGKSTGPHLHIRIRKSGKSVDPNVFVDYLKDYITQLQNKMAYVRFGTKPNKELNIENLMATLRQFDVKFPQIVAAQALLETGYFTSRVCLENNNLFGLRRPSNGSYYTFSAPIIGA